MAKPIFVLKVDVNTPEDKAEEIRDKLEVKLKGEYHVLIIRCKTDGEVTCECHGIG